VNVRVSTTVSIDPQAWADTFGVDRKDVRRDVQRYFAQELQNLRVLEEVGTRTPQE